LIERFTEADLGSSDPEYEQFIVANDKSRDIGFGGPDRTQRDE
jgi:hypothetical protein